MSSPTYDVLWNNVPDNLKNNDLIEKYISTISEIFDEVREEINNQKYFNDYAKTSLEEINIISQDYGIEFPRNISEDIKRRVTRDADEIFARLGTRQALNWAIRILGITEFEIGEIWAPNPDLLRTGYYKALGDANVDRYTINNNSYIDFYVGEEVVKDNGTFFEGYSYQDQFKSNLFTDIPIYGETYSNYTDIDFTDTVSKTPYVAVKIFADDDDFGVLLESKTDPDTGDVYEYTTSEKKVIISQIINYFVQVLQRTANTKILVVTDLFEFFDGFYLEDYSLEFTFGTNIGKIGGVAPIGYHPLFKIGEYVIGKIGDGSFDNLPVDNTLDKVPHEYNLYAPVGNRGPHRIFLDNDATVEITNRLSGYAMLIEKNEKAFASTPWEYVKTIGYNQTHTETFSSTHTLRITYVNDPSGTSNQPDMPSPIKISYN